jgi:hypothetical protein
MRVKVFERLLSVNRGLGQVIGDLKSLDSVEELKGDSLAKFAVDAERLKAAVNRFVAEMVRIDADNEAARIDKMRTPETQTTTT